MLSKKGRSPRQSNHSILRSTERMNQLSYLKYFCNFFHYIGFCPFKIQQNKNTNRLTFNSCIFFKVLSFITISTALANSIIWLIQDFMQKKENIADLRKEFGIFSTLTDFLFQLAIFNVFYRKNKQFLEILQMFESSPATIFIITKKNPKVKYFQQRSILSVLASYTYCIFRS